MIRFYIWWSKTSHLILILRPVLVIFGSCSSIVLYQLVSSLIYTHSHTLAEVLMELKENKQNWIIIFIEGKWLSAKIYHSYLLPDRIFATFWIRYHPYGRKQRRTKEPLDESEREWKCWFRTQHSKTKIMASGPITSWQTDGETMETMRDFTLGGAPKLLQMVTAAMKLKDTCSLEENLWPM